MTRPNANLLLIAKAFTAEFNEVIAKCVNDNLFIGEGDPNAKILIIGKEIGGCRPTSIEDIISTSQLMIQGNIESWTNPFGYPINRIKTDVFSHGRNPTWNNYQKLVGSILECDIGHDNYNFLDYCFMTELSDVCIPNSDYAKELPASERSLFETLRTESINKRIELFKMDFFQKFPIVVMACGHYPRKYAFDIESVFRVKWNGITESLSSGNFYNVHRNTDKVLIHTRQMSSGISNELISKIGSICKLIH